MASACETQPRASAHHKINRPSRQRPGRISRDVHPGTRPVTDTLGLRGLPCPTMWESSKCRREKDCVSIRPLAASRGLSRTRRSFNRKPKIRAPTVFNKCHRGPRHTFRGQGPATTSPSLSRRTSYGRSCDSCWGRVYFGSRSGSRPPHAARDSARPAATMHATHRGRLTSYPSVVRLAIHFKGFGL